MASKKSQPNTQATSVSISATKSSGMNAPASPWKWVYIVGALVAGVTSAIGFTNLIFSWVMLIVGLLVGFLYFDSDDVTNFGLRYLIVVGVAAYPSLYLSGTGMPGMYVSGFLNGFVNFLGPVLLAQIIAAFWKKYFQ